MAIRNIVKEGDPILNKVCRPVTRFDDRLATLLDDMHETMIQADGLGLAGPPVGVRRRPFAAGAPPAAPAVVACYQAKTALLSDNRTGGASALASAAVDASASVDDGHAVLNLHSADGASALASTAADATLGNLMCHSRTLLSTRA